MYGSSMFPLTLRAIQHFSQYEPVIMAGVGALHNDDSLKIYQAGAQYFQPHELIWRNYN
jgi:hypothetical protein